MSLGANTSKVKPIQQAAAALILGSIAVQALGFIKSLILAHFYGTSAELDAYFLSLAPVNGLSGLLSSAAQAALVPQYLVLSEKKGSQHASSVLLTIFCILMAAAAGIALIFWQSSSIIAKLLGSGFDTPLVDFTAILIAYSGALLLVTVMDNMMTCLFLAHRRFLFSSSTPLISGAVSLLYILFFHRFGVLSIMQGLIAGMLLQGAIVAYAARMYFQKPVFPLPFSHPDVRETAKQLFPLLLGGSLSHINVMVDQMMASTLPSGSIAALHYAGKLHRSITQLCIMTASKAVLPFMAKQAAEKDFEGLRRTFRDVAQRTLLLLIPLSIGIFLFGAPCIRLLFKRGRFTAESVEAVSGAWKAYAVGLSLQAIGILAVRVFNALQKNRLVMFVAALNIVLNLCFNWIFMKLWGHVGIALSTSAVYAASTGLLLWLLSKHFRQQSLKERN